MKSHLSEYYRRHSRFLVMAVVAVTLSACKAGSGQGLTVNGQPLDGAGPPSETDSYARVQAIFDARCTVCHSGAGAPQGLILSAPVSYQNLVGVPSAQRPELSRIEPDDAEASYLVRKIRGDSTIIGGQMPLNGPPYLTDAQVQTVVDWVNAGAPPATQLGEKSEFVAELSDFAGYANWAAVDYSVGMSNPSLGGLHSSDSLEFSRRVYANATAMQSDEDEFDVGSILVKEVFSYASGSKEFAEEGGLLAMVKRGNGFNSDHAGWEWFMLSPDLSQVLARGADVMDDGCNLCHSAAPSSAASEFGGKDYVFEHPSEFIASNEFFEGYSDWPLIDERQDANPLLASSAHGADAQGNTRRIYKKQLYANPDSAAQGYPVGTALVKETLSAGELIEVTAMVKRGGAFNPEFGSWEWFMLDPNTRHVKIMEDGTEARGANLMEGMCNGCHLAASAESGEGLDFVFKHGGDPFNNNEEFFAELSDLADYQNWPIVDYSIGATNASLGGAHEALADDYARVVYANDQAVNVGGQTYPKGAILVKEVATWRDGHKELAPQMGLLAMAKRGGVFNADHNGWEWLELDSNLTQILGRGADYFDGACNTCHAQAKAAGVGTDYVFRHPSEFIAQSVDFSEYQSWLQIDERTGSGPLLTEGAHVSNDPSASRRVYKKQPYAQPLDAAGGYPVGTTIVKEVVKDGAVIELLAMVKRGGAFNANHGHWEWFMLDPRDGSIAEDETGTPMRGADLMEGMCNGCHAAADSDSTLGKDYVFIHDNDPALGSM